MRGQVFGNRQNRSGHAALLTSAFHDLRLEADWLQPVDTVEKVDRGDAHIVSQQE